MTNNSDRNKYSTVQALRAGIAEVDRRLHRRTQPASELRYDRDRLVAGDHAFSVDEASFKQICQAVGAPAGYLNELGEPYKSRLISRHLGRGDHLEHLESRHLLGKRRRDREHVTVVADGEQFLSFARPDLQTLLGVDVLDASLDGARLGLQRRAQSMVVHRAEVTNLGYSLDLRLPAMAVEFQRGDVINGGLVVDFSFVGQHATQIETFLFRLVCSNGAIRRECVAGRRGGASRIRRHTRNPDAVAAMLDDVRTFAERIARGLDAKLKSIGQLRKQPITDVSTFISRQLTNVPRLHSKRLVRRIIGRLESEAGPFTAYDALNAMTAVASHDPDITPNIRAALLRLSGVLATSPQHLCPNCYRLLSVS